MKIICNAGHDLSSPGAQSGSSNESEMTMKLRDKIIPLLERMGYEVLIVPDNLNLRQSIAWVNTRATKEDFAFSIHFNYNRYPNIGGTEVYYFNKDEAKLADVFSQHVSVAIGINNRGALHDSLTWVKSLGWLRKLVCDSVLVEVCYLSNENDMKKFNHDYDRTAKGFENAIRRLYPIKKKINEDYQAQLTMLQRMLSALWKQYYQLVEQYQNGKA